MNCDGKVVYGLEKKPPLFSHKVEQIEINISLLIKVMPALQNSNIIEKVLIIPSQEITAFNTFM